MLKKWLSVILIGLLAVIIVNLQTGCASKGPAAPANAPAPGTPTATPTATVTSTATAVIVVTGNITMPALQTGRTIRVSFYSSLADLSSPDNSFTGTCTANPMPYSLTLSAGSYYAVAVVDVDNNSMTLSPNAGDYAGVYGAVWPAWPGAKNAAVSASSTAFDISLVTAGNNITGTITIPADQTGKQFWVLLDQDTNGGNSNYAAIEMVACPAGTAIPYGMVVLIPGTYYLYGGVNVDNSNGPPNSGDYIGFYGVSAPYYASPSSPNVTIDVASPITKDFTEGILP